MGLTTELIIACYNKPDYLNCVLSALVQQSCMPDGVCFADDGSGAEVKTVIDQFIQSDICPARHVWHEDNGFQKTKILNRAIATSKADYLIFIDDDCLMHPRYIERHFALRQPQLYLSGGLIRLNKAQTEAQLIARQVAWQNGTLKGWQPKNLSDRLKAMPFAPSIMGVLDRLTTVQKNWSGCNASCFRADALAVNGFDERVTYGAEDKEFGYRLANAGTKGRHIRYSAPLYHLDHSRGYVDEDRAKQNKLYAKSIRKSGTKWTEFGIQQ